MLNFPATRYKIHGTWRQIYHLHLDGATQLTPLLTFKHPFIVDWTRTSDTAHTSDCNDLLPPSVRVSHLPLLSPPFPASIFTHAPLDVHLEQLSTCLLQSQIDRDRTVWARPALCWFVSLDRSQPEKALVHQRVFKRVCVCFDYKDSRFSSITVLKTYLHYIRLSLYDIDDVCPTVTTATVHSLSWPAREQRYSDIWRQERMQRPMPGNTPRFTL